MTEDKIYLRTPDGELQAVERRDFDSEELLQELLENHPELLSGDQINPDRPVRWLLISREAGVPSEEGASDRWSMDHLLLDQDAIPTIVEVKRSTDTRTRRRVVGQVLDYAANAKEYWPADRIRVLASEQYGGPDEADLEVLRLLDEQGDAQEDVEWYWDQVEENMAQGRMRLLFVADELPSELTRIIYFLNRHTRDYLEVLGVQVRQYNAGELEAFVPMVVGHSEMTREKSSRRRGSRTPITVDELEEKTSPEAFELFSRILEEAEAHGLSVSRSPKGFNVAPEEGGDRSRLLYVFHRGAHNRDHDFLWAYTKPVPKALQSFAHEQYGEVPEASEMGQYTYEVLLDEDGLEAGYELWSAVLQVAERMQREGLD